MRGSFGGLIGWGALVVALSGCDIGNTACLCRGCGWGDTADSGWSGWPGDTANPNGDSDSPSGDCDSPNGDSGGPNGGHVVYDGPYVELPSDTVGFCDANGGQTCDASLTDGDWVAISADTTYTCGTARSYSASFGAHTVQRVGGSVAITPAIALSGDLAASSDDYAAYADAVPEPPRLRMTVDDAGITVDPADLLALIAASGDPSIVPVIDGVSVTADADCVTIVVQGHACGECGAVCPFTTTIWVSSLDTVSGYGPVTAAQ